MRTAEKFEGRGAHRSVCCVAVVFKGHRRFYNFSGVGIFIDMTVGLLRCNLDIEGRPRLRFLKVYRLSEYCNRIKRYF